MNRDALLATLIGLGLGLVITGVIVISPAIIRALPKIYIRLPFASTQRHKPSVTPTPTAIKFTIDSPLPETIEDSNQILVSGHALPGATVIVESQSDEDVLIASSEGKYAGTVTLSEGKNTISVTSYFNKNEESKTIDVYFRQP